jgi:CRP/FNR family transcriptional regulator, cyclic AMP receptor protein
MSFFDYPTAADPVRGAAAPSAGAETEVFLADASERDWADLLAHTRRLKVPAGEKLIGRRSLGRSLFMVVDGTLEVRLPGRFGRSRPSAALGPGSVIGEVAFFDGKARSADVLAVTPSEVAELTREGLSTLARERPELAMSVLLDLGRILAQRLRSTQEEG